MEDKTAIAEAISAFFLRVPEIRFNNPIVYSTQDPNVAFASYQLEVKVPENGRTYRLKYIGLFSRAQR